MVRTSEFQPQLWPVPWEVETMRWQDGNTETVSVDRQKTMPNSAPEGFKATDNETVMDATDAGRT